MTTQSRLKKPTHGAIQKIDDRMVDAEKAARLIEDVAKRLLNLFSLIWIGIFVSLERRKIPWVIDVMAKQGAENKAGILKELLTDQTADNGLPAKTNEYKKGT